ncbi:MAG: DnaA/Hda family protein, partial [Candidatus Omnitrophica bacterium]|nr:DnaA/Hda family protein [Candidatus Omnitrophota bacterium]
MVDLINLWEQVKLLLKEKVGQSAFETWLQPLKVRANEGDTLWLEAPDTFFKEWVEKYYGSLIQDAIRSAAEASNIKLCLEVSHFQQPVSNTPFISSRPKSMESLKTTVLNSRYTFENFVVGPSNKHAHAYSLAVAEAPAKTYNPLLIYGGVGLGKTHLIQAICHHVRKKFPDNFNICYISSERFTNELIDA